MNKTIIGILTDFGNDFAVASIKGVILCELPNATIVDVDHDIEKFSVLSGAFVIQQAHAFFPEQTYFLCVVDPGVGSERNEIYVRSGNYHFVGPDNGIFHNLLDGPDVQAYRIDGKSFNPSSHTFHGRDLFAPALIALAQGRRDFLEPVDIASLVRLDLTKDQQVIVYIDSFGNIKTNFSVTKEQSKTIRSASITINDTVHNAIFVKTFSDTFVGQLICYRGSNNTLEIALNRGSAGALLNVRAGDQLTIKLHDRKGAI